MMTIFGEIKPMRDFTALDKRNERFGCNVIPTLLTGAVDKVSMHHVDWNRTRPLMVVIDILGHHGHMLAPALPRGQRTMRLIGPGVAHLWIEFAGEGIEERRIPDEGV